MNILSAMLANRPVTIDDIQTFVDTKVPESTYLEYKRGIWKGDEDEDLAEGFRRYVSGFANAEGGLFIVGIVGGEDAQGSDKWSIEGARCPDQKGWTDWLNNVLQSIAVRARTNWKSIDTPNGTQVVVVAVDRAQELIRLHKKKRLGCHLRVGSSTVLIDDTLYADLVLGRRVKPDLEVLPIECAVGQDSLGPYVRVHCRLHNQGLVWVPDVTLALIGYFQAGAAASESIRRQLDVRVGPGTERLSLAIAGDDAWNQQVAAGQSSPQWLSRQHALVNRGLSPFVTIDLATRVNRFPVCGLGSEWAWCGAILAVPMNGSPIWAQVSAYGYSGGTTSQGRMWIPDKEQLPVVAWFCGPDAHRELGEIAANDHEKR